MKSGLAKSSISVIATLMFFLNSLLSQTDSTIARVNQVEAGRWREDLRFLSEQLPRRHKNLFHSMTKEEFEASVNRLNERIPMLSRHQIIVEIARIGAMIGDGHSGLRPLRDPKLNFRFYPIKLYHFKDGIFVQSADKSFASIVGARVLKIGDTPIDEVYKATAELVPRDNEMTLKNLTPFLLSQAEVLHALGFVQDMENAEFTIENNGKRRVVALAPMPLGSTIGFGRNLGWVDARDQAKTPMPLWLKDPENLFWFEYLTDTRTVYVQLNAVANKPPVEGKPRETMGDFFQTVFAFVDAYPVDRFILDLRMNGGGSSELNKSIIHGLIRSDKVNQSGKLFVSIGRRTFSAAQNLVNELEEHTNALFIGEPTGGRPNHYGDAVRIILPNSGIAFSASTLWHQEAGARDKRSWTAPHLAAELTAAEYRSNIDPVMSLIMKYRHDPSKEIIQLLMDAVSAKQYSVAEQRFKEFLDDPVHAYVSAEGQVNTLGYRLLSRGQTEDAIEIFKLNAKMYPNSSNVYDSLGDAYLKAGKNDLAFQNYAQSLKLNPANANAVEMLKRLQAK